MVIRSASAEAVAVIAPAVTAATATTTRRRPRKAPPRPSCRLSLVDAVVAGLAAAAAKKQKCRYPDSVRGPSARPLLAVVASSERAVFRVCPRGPR
ncbi:hypothetical protein HPB47_020417 [Ixodes persulcatus]|uniref:Uncharacterized protein n=1 Tax=Ixodes persulcatus TaxID=34615 RepID=A0AC60QFQ7_IXOPE|nr:hypothetical protein HPB47_020417 [Ixodes persulcatus]